ncbi:MAG: alpha/beta hydrolase [Clostridia bacterium]|nr:alpha/beta hydrolase [Clostridia bacterium]
MFLHGYLSSKEAFANQIAYFSRFYRVTALDFIGFGKSPPLTESYSVGDYAQWLQGVLAALGVEKPHVIAHSFGCRVAVKLASEQPDAFDKILLTGPAGVILKRGFSYRVKVGAYRLVKRIAPKLAERKFGSKEYRTLTPLMKESYKKIVNEDLRECAKKVKNQVLLVEGRADKTTPLQEAKAYLECFRNGKLRLIDGGHFAFVDSPVAFNLIAEEFFYE